MQTLPGGLVPSQERGVPHLPSTSQRLVGGRGWGWAGLIPAWLSGALGVKSPYHQGFPSPHPGQTQAKEGGSLGSCSFALSYWIDRYRQDTGQGAHTLLPQLSDMWGRASLALLEQTA